MKIQRAGEIAGAFHKDKNSGCGRLTMKRKSGLGFRHG